MSSVKGLLEAFISGTKHIFRRRMTLRYPDVKLDLGVGYEYDPKKNVGLPGYKGRHILYLDKCTGCQLCAIACENIANCIEMVKVDVSVPVNKKSIFPQIDYGNCVFCGFCVAPDTEVAVNPGLKEISQLQVGSLVLTHTGEYKPVTRLWDVLYTGPMYRIRVLGNPMPLKCTRDHKVLAVRRARSKRADGRLLRNKGPIEFVLPEEMKKGDYLLTPIPKKTQDLDVYRQVVGMYKHERAKVPLEIPCSPDLFRLIGYYLAEGFCEGGRTVRFSFDALQREYIEDVKGLVREFFDKDAKEEKNSGRGINVRLDSAVAEAFFAQFGKGAENKRLTEWAMCAPPEKQAQLVRGLWRGDGALIKQKRQEYLNISTTSKVLAFQIKLVLARLGVVACVEEEQPEGKKRAYRINAFGKYAKRMGYACGIPFDYSRSKDAVKFHIDTDYVYSPIASIESFWVEEERVMDVTVQDDHTFVPAGVVTSNCVDACPFYALFMTDDYELSSFDKKSLIYTPQMLALPPTKRGTVRLEVDKRGAHHTS